MAHVDPLAGRSPLYLIQEGPKQGEPCACFDVSTNGTIAEAYVESDAALIADLFTRHEDGPEASTPTPRERLLQAIDLVTGVMAELDTETIPCGCPDHVRHYRNFAAALAHDQLEGALSRLEKTAYGGAVSELSGVEPGKPDRLNRTLARSVAARVGAARRPARQP